MVWTAVWNNKKYILLNSINLNKSSKEVTFSDVVVDFTNKNIEDLPFAQQEVKIYDENMQLKFTGFVADYKLPELQNKDTDNSLSISLFSPRQMTTKRTVTIIRTAKLQEIIEQTIKVLYEDGFSLSELNIPDKTITVKLISRTVEEVLNYLSHKYSLYWNIDELKHIYISSIDYMLNKEVKKDINISNYKEEVKGFLSLTPSVENTNYSNIINVKNARIFHEKFYLANSFLNITLKKGDRLDFENPIDISYDTAKRVAGDLYTQGYSTSITNLQILYNNDQEAYIISGFNTSGDIQNGINSKNISRDDSTENLFTLNIDSTFKNLATGFTYKGENTITVQAINSQTYLKYANMKLINWHEIEKYKGKITPSGQIESILDVEGGWFTVEELIDYVRSVLTANNKQTNKVIIQCDEDNNFVVGDRIEINLKEYYTQGNYIVTSTKENKEGNFPSQFTIELRNTNLLENYIDLFRSNLNIEEQESQVETEYVIEYAEEEVISEIHETILNSEKNSTLNFELR